MTDSAFASRIPLSPSDSQRRPYGVANQLFACSARESSCAIPDM